ncbi:DUF3820 family protein [bacterium]|nr:DUF3820 family protein [bacterium]MBU1994295.1 DUF3820 family protein [bacterium]
MTRPKFIFTKHARFFSVYIENIEQLSVLQIQNIENFVKIRKGVFDFDTYSFVIQKNLEFQDFISLIGHCSIDAICKEKNFQIQSEAKIEFGKYKGMQYTEVPDSYLMWLRSNYKGKDRNIIEAELKIRNI